MKKIILTWRSCFIDYRLVESKPNYYTVQEYDRCEWVNKDHISDSSIQDLISILVNQGAQGVKNDNIRTN